MKKTISALLVLATIASASASASELSCLETYKRIEEAQSSRNDKLKFAGIAGSGLLFIASAGLGAPVILGTMGYGMVTRGTSKYTISADALEAADAGELSDFNFEVFVKKVNKKLKKANHEQVSGETVASVLVEGNRSLAICPEVINTKTGEVIRTAFDTKTLQDYVIEQIIQ